MKKNLRKKVILPVLIAIALVAIVAVIITPGFAAWVAGFSATAQVKEPTTSLPLDSGPVSIFPGETYTLAGEFKNAAPVAYGMIYYTGAYYEWNEIGGPGAALSTNPVATRKSENITLAQPNAQPQAGGMGVSVATLTMVIDPDGPEGPLPSVNYLPGQKINIAANGVHFIVVKARVRAGAYPGTIRVYIDPQREEPNP